MQTPNSIETADLVLELPVQVDYGLDGEGITRIFTVRVAVGPLSLDVTSLLTEDDFYTLFNQIDQWYDEVL